MRDWKNMLDSTFSFWKGRESMVVKLGTYLYAGHLLGVCCLHITVWDTIREGKLGPCPPALIIWEGKMHAFGDTGRSLDPEWIYSNSERTTWRTSSWRARWLPPSFRLCPFLEGLPLTIYKSSQTGSCEPDWFSGARWLVPMSQTGGSHVQPQTLRKFSTDGQCPVPLPCGVWWK